MADAETYTCPNCKRGVPVANRVLHEGFCARNNQACPVCGEVVHVECECGQQVVNSELEEHKRTQCPCRPATCRFCSIPLKFKDIAEHEEYCGSRTSKCELCFKYVKVRDMDEHLVSGCKYIGAPTASAAPRELYAGLHRFHRFRPGSRRFLTASPSVDEDDRDFVLEQRQSLADYVAGELSRVPVAAAPRTRQQQQQQQPQPQQQRPYRGAPAGGLGGAPELLAPSYGAFVCPKCGDTAPNYEELQLHAFTVCPMREREREQAAAAAAAGDGAEGPSVCPQCGLHCANYEEMQVHAFTTCRLRSPDQKPTRPSVRPAQQQQQPAVRRANAPAGAAAVPQRAARGYDSSMPASLSKRRAVGAAPAAAAAVPAAGAPRVARQPAGAQVGRPNSSPPHHRAQHSRPEAMARRRIEPSSSSSSLPLPLSIDGAPIARPHQRVGATAAADTAAAAGAPGTVAATAGGRTTAAARATAPHAPGAGAAAAGPVRARVVRAARPVGGAGAAAAQGAHRTARQTGRPEDRVVVCPLPHESPDLA
eukprot:m51a1_g3896 hypothetical protein (536) ;mRNA; r:84999-86987